MSGSRKQKIGKKQTDSLLVNGARMQAEPMKAEETNKRTWLQKMETAGKQAGFRNAERTGKLAGVQDRTEIWLEQAALWKEKAISLLFPRRCPVCGEIVVPKGDLICPACRRRLSFVSGPTCMRCGKELALPDSEYCSTCSRHRRTFTAGAALLNYNEVSAWSMVQIKYKNKREFLDFYAEEMYHRLGKKVIGWHAQAFIPVPVHPSRMRSRGYNQAEALAERLASFPGFDRMPVITDCLIRIRKTAPQKELDPGQRLRNLEQAFTVLQVPEGLDRVILVDDIYTTGSTAEACTRVLHRAGISKVYVLTICTSGDR